MYELKPLGILTTQVEHQENSLQSIKMKFIVSLVFFSGTKLICHALQVRGSKRFNVGEES